MLAGTQAGRVDRDAPASGAHLVQRTAYVDAVVKGSRGDGLLAVDDDGYLSWRLMVDQRPADGDGLLPGGDGRGRAAANLDFVESAAHRSRQFRRCQTMLEGEEGD